MTHKTPQASGLPIFRSVKGSVSSAALIVETLAARGELTLSELHAALFTGFHYRISYQGVRKVVLGLQEDGVLNSSSGKFTLNRHWLLKARGAVDRLLTMSSLVSGHKQLASLENFDLYHAGSLYAADTFWGELLVQLCEEEKPKDHYLLSLNHYAFWLPLNTGRETELFSVLRGKGWQVEFIFARHSKLNDWAIKLYRSIDLDAGVRDLSAIPNTTYYNVIGDRIIEVILQPKLADLATRVGSQVPGKIAPKELYKLAHTPGDAQLRVYRNQMLAESLRKLAGR
jgi:hypothetical protein